MDNSMNGQIEERETNVFGEKSMLEIADKAESFIKQLQVLGYDKKTFRFERELTSQEILTYKKRLSELIDAVDTLRHNSE